MIVSLLIGRGGSRGVPGKNTMPILGRPLMTYPILAAQHAKHVDRLFLSTDDEAIAKIGEGAGAELIDRPPHLGADDALVEDVVQHGYHAIVERVGPIEALVLLFCNSATIPLGMIDAGIEQLRADPTLDSAVSVSRYNEYSPVRAMRVDENGLLDSYVDVSAIPNASCDRDSAEDCWYCDCSVWVLRPRCVDPLSGRLPFRWTGQKVKPLPQEGGLDIDQPHGIAQTEWWLRSHGFTGSTTPYESGA
jgi:CMP-N-acetylneuraminic acid synthetase